MRERKSKKVSIRVNEALLALLSLLTAAVTWMDALIDFEVTVVV